MERPLFAMYRSTVDPAPTSAPRRLDITKIAFQSRQPQFLSGPRAGGRGKVYLAVGSGDASVR